MLRNKLGRISIPFMMLGLVVLLSGCAGLLHFGEQINKAWSGVSAVMTTYDQDGNKIDEVKGESFNFSRDSRFDTTNSEGTSNRDSSVLLISIGKSHISHVGSTMILAEKGLEDVTDKVDKRVALNNLEAGTPFINSFIEKNRNLWSGKSKTLMIRSQDGLPIAVYSGNKVEIFATDIPKSTWFRVDGKMLLVYRADYTVYDTDLLKKDNVEIIKD